jgi:ABC-2 type transport system ATP-binding protein
VGVLRLKGAKIGTVVFKNPFVFNRIKGPSLSASPELLLLDEPTASLDPDTGDWVRGYLESYRERTGATILMASHNMAEVERLCSEVMMMKAGRIVDRGSPQVLIDRYGRTNLEEVFLHIAREPRVELELAK